VRYVEFSYDSAPRDRGALVPMEGENILLPISNEQIEQAVVVVIADTTTLSTTEAWQSSLQRHIGKCTVAIVVIQVSASSPW
jgi:hypothetical protein